MIKHRQLLVLLAIFISSSLASAQEPGLRRIKYNHPGLAVDLGVGLWAWPIPIDHDGDGDWDLVVVCPDKPCNGAWLFENPSQDAKEKDPVFKPAKRLSHGPSNIMSSYVNGKTIVLGPATEYPDFLKSGLSKGVKLGLPDNVHPNKLRANQWRYADYDGDGHQDIIVGAEDWTDYGWDNAYDKQGRWTRGPLHGLVYWLRNEGKNDDKGKPQYAKAELIKAGPDRKPVDVFGMPSPNFADFDGDGDWDLLCGDFLGGLTYFENQGSRTQPQLAAGRRLPFQMHLEMIVPVAVDWDHDGDQDLVVGQEDGRVALIENRGQTLEGMPLFEYPRFFRQEADEVKFGALATPVGFDWDGDGDEDLLCGNTAGHVGFVENLGAGKSPNEPRWAAPRLLDADGRTIHIQAGPNGSIQGPAEARWGYTTFSVADWNHDGLPDLVVNSILGQVVWYKNVGTRKEPRLTESEPIQVQWTGEPPKPVWLWRQPGAKELWTQWRTTPLVFDWNHDGLNDLLMLDHEGYFTFFERSRDQLTLLPGKRIFQGAKGSASFDSNGLSVSPLGGPLRLNVGLAGRSGRRKLSLADWDGDGRTDLLVNSRNVNVLRNVADQGQGALFQDLGQIDQKVILAGHDTSPTTVDWDRDGDRDLLVGGEDGYFYFLENKQTNTEKK